jgi:regulation of enolase protein 1 (concanavalin A-like superfamily)
VQSGTSGTPKWLKLRRDEGGYSAYWSNNGTTWNQVGTKLTLAGAAATQDVGIFEMSHEAAAKSADFSQFAINTEPTDPTTPDPVSDPLVCPTGPLSDEFDSPSLLAKWGLRYAPGRPITQSGGSLNLPVTTGDINEANTGPVSFAGQPVPAGDWTATTKITLEHSSHWQWAGLVVHRSDNEYNKLAFVRNSAGGRFVEFQSETNGSRTTPGAPAVPADFPTTIYLRLVNTGGTLTAAYSSNGEAWTNVSGSTPLKTDARIGLMAAGDLGTTPRVAQVDWFRFTPEPQATEIEPNDEFDGTQLDGCRWARSVRYNSNAEEVKDGHLRITTQPGDINGNNPVSPRNFILQDAPEGDWVATTRFKAPMKHRWQLAGLLMYGDDDNYVKADVVAYNAPGAALDLRAEASREVGGAISGGSNVNIADSTESGYWYIRVTKTGNQYVSEVSDGGTNWTPIGSGITFDEPLDALGLMAIGPQQEEPVTVDFDYFHLEAGEEDATAPTTQLTLDPAAPNGANGWYTSAPSFTLSADDGEGSGVESTEYRVGDGEWTAYAGEPVSLADAGDGTVEISFRSTDVAGNVEEAGSTTVRLDRVAPETSASQAPDGDSVVVTLAATDATSGVASTEYRVDDGAWTAYTAPVRLDEPGEHVVAFRSTDEAGLVEETRTVSVIVEDTTGPRVVITGIRDGATYRTSQKLTIGWRVTPTGDAVRSVVARIDGKRVREGRLNLARLGTGRHKLVVTATDTAGNVTIATVRFRVVRR